MTHARPPESGTKNRGALDAVGAALGRILAEEGDRLFLWGPVLFGGGAAAYFALDHEPEWISAAALTAGLVAVYLLARPWPLAGLIAAALLCGGLGFANAKLRTMWVAGPLVTRDLGVVTVRGWVERVEPREKRQRLTLRVREIERLDASRTPFRVRVTSAFKEPLPLTGTPVVVKAVLRPVPEPVEPGGFDFARTAWFLRLGAVGFIIAPPVADEQGPPAPAYLAAIARIDHVRGAINAQIADALPGVKGAIAMALITGERGAIPEDVVSDLRISGLAHILSISGLHMALMAGSLYWLVRALLAAFPAIALRFPIKKWAAVAALLGGTFYLALSGAAVATQRSYIMMAILFCAILLERPALTLRNVAMAAWIILVLFPESLFDVGFQMSFAAVVGIVAVYEETARRAQPWRPNALWAQAASRALNYMLGIGLTTLVASIAIAPFSAYHFHTLSQYGLIGNMLAMPLVGMVIMPAALATLLLMPFGLETWPLALMGWGLEWLMAAAHMVAGWEGAVIHVAALPAVSLALMALGGLWLCLWRTRWRAAGVVIAALGVFLAPTMQRPDILIDREGKLHAVRDEEGRLATVKPRKTYSLEQWLRADGDGREPAQAAEAQVFSCDELACLATVRGKTVAFIRHPAALEEECARSDIVVVQVPFDGPCAKARVIVDRIDVWAAGAHALYLDGQSIRIETVAGARGTRPWVQVRRRRDETPSGTALAEEPEADDEP